MKNETLNDMIDIVFVKYIMKYYENEGISAKEAKKYTALYKDLFPNLWSNGDSLDRENVYQLILMARADARAKQNKYQRVVDEFDTKFGKDLKLIEG